MDYTIHRNEELETEQKRKKIVGLLKAETWENCSLDTLETIFWFLDGEKENR